MWYLSVIVRGIGTCGPWSTGRHVYVRRTIANTCHIIGAGGICATVRTSEARRRLRVCRDGQGQPVRVRQMRCDIRWQAHEGRRFDGLKRKVA
jgi:hypothetical protein